MVGMTTTAIHTFTLSSGNTANSGGSSSGSARSGRQGSHSNGRLKVQGRHKATAPAMVHKAATAKQRRLVGCCEVLVSRTTHKLIMVGSNPRTQ